MASAKRAGSTDLTHFDALVAHPQAFHIFQALRVIEAEYSDAPRLGESKRPRQDRVRLKQEAEPAFPATTIADFTPANGENPGVMINRFFGLFGSNGPLPIHLTEYARDRVRNHRDSTFIAFADMFTHRMLGLLYRAYSTGQPAPSFDRPGDDPFEDKVSAIAGHFGKHLRNRDAMPDLTKRHFAGHIGHGPKNASGLMAILSSFFNAPVEMEDFVGCWLELDPSDQWAVGGSLGLGQGTSLGGRVWSRTSKFRIVLGPLSLPEFEKMLPGGTSFKRLSAIVRNYIGDVMDWDVNVILRKEDVPEPILGQTTSLGRSCWIGDRDTSRDADELYLSP